jgi:hypothetical protein
VYGLKEWLAIKNANQWCLNTESLTMKAM